MKFSVTGLWHDKNVNLVGEFQSGSRVALLGDSGSGKTTLLRFLSGVIRHPGAHVSIGDQPVKNAWRAASTLVHQHPVMFAHHRVLETIKYGEKYCQTSQEIPWQRWLAQLELEDLVDQPCLQLSGGQQQRVALLRALMSRPGWLLLDESFSAMDLKRVINACEVVAEYCHITGAGIVLASHSEVPQRFLCSSVYAVENLTGQYHENLFKVLNSSANRAHITTIFVDAAETENGFLKVNFNDQRIYVSVPDRWHSGKARISIDATEISIALGDQHQTSMVNRIRAVIQSTKPITNNSMLITLDVGGQRLLTMISQWSWQRLNLALGQTVFAEFKVGAVQWHGQT